ncbi:MAG: DUF2878 family protein [Planctomycetota bacterium]|nr:MAG: DUF2878 family protein [Planctomycetota bacterium]
MRAAALTAEPLFGRYDPRTNRRYAVALLVCHQAAWCALVLGARAGPLAYAAGGTLGVLEITGGAWGFLAIGVGWALAIAVLLRSVSGPGSRRRGADPGGQRPPERDPASRRQRRRRTVCRGRR